MNILHISPYVPSTRANHAGGVCMGKQIETLAINNNVYNLAFINDNLERTLAKSFEKDTSSFVSSNKLTMALNALKTLYRPNLFGIRNSICFSFKLIHMVKKYNIDAIHAEFTAMGQFLWIKHFFPRLQFNLVEHDVTLQSYERMANMYSGIKGLHYKIQRDLVKSKEKKYCTKADNVFTFNDKDKKLLKKFYDVDAIVLTPYYGLDIKENNKNDKIPGSICFVGQMARQENHDAAMRLVDIFNSINNDGLSLYLIGAKPREELLQRQNEKIHCTGFVEDINKEIEKCELAVFPLTFGAGIKLKVLLAFGLGLPVITSSIGAEGIDEEGKVLILAESDDSYKKEITKLIRNKSLLNELSKKSTQYVSENFGWEKSVKILNDIYH